jgi:hypothetical protein
VGGIAEGVLDDHTAAEIMPDRIFLGHADAAMQLDRVLRHEFARLADADLCHRNVVSALGGIGFFDHHRRQHRHAAPALELHQHLSGTVLQDLVLAYRPAELLAGPQIFEGHRLHRLHRADGFGGSRGNARLDDPLDYREPGSDLAQYVLLADLDTAQ